ncbi:MAG TPA: peptidylprolyl isomerase [Thermomicrobiales bacterium]|nr:peptidylprolyl isomerase [Thermomicrobiales bacterium]
MSSTNTRAPRGNRTAKKKQPAVSQRWLVIGGVAVVVLAVAVGLFLNRSSDTVQAGECWSGDPSTSAGYPQWDSAPAMTIDSGKTYTATIETSQGTITAELMADKAPNTVNNFVCLANAGYYSNVPFHRIIAGFMIQTGDPTGTGAGGPGYKFDDELPGDDLSYERGVLAMANAGPNTNGSQFFINHQDNTQNLPKSYTIFGKVTEGMDVVDKIAAVPVTASATGEPSSPTTPVTITKVTISET